MTGTDASTLAMATHTNLVLLRYVMSYPIFYAVRFEASDLFEFFCMNTQQWRYFCEVVEIDTAFVRTFDAGALT
jgi:hypothetical protein